MTKTGTCLELEVIVAVKFISAGCKSVSFV